MPEPGRRHLLRDHRGLTTDAPSRAQEGYKTPCPENLYNIAPEGKAQLYTAAEIRAAAADGLQIWLDVGRRWPRVPCRMAATVRGWVTAVGERGAIYQAWAGDFHGSPSPAEIVTA